MNNIPIRENGCRMASLASGSVSSDSGGGKSTRVDVPPRVFGQLTNNHVDQCRACAAGEKFVS